MKIATAVFKPMLALCVACVLPTVVHATVVYDTITVIDGGRAVLVAVTATQAELTANPFAFFYVPGIAVNRGEFGHAMLVTVGEVPVDIVGIATGGPDGLDLSFSPGEQASSSSLTNIIAATGAPIDLTRYLGFGLRASGDTASFTASGQFTVVSNAASVGSVPEPFTWTLMIVGFLAVGSGLRRNARVARTARLLPDRIG